MIHIEGFSDKVHRSEFHRLYGSFDCAERGHHDYRGQRIVFSRCLKHLEPVLARQLQICQDKVRPQLAYLLYPFTAAACNDYLITLDLKSFLQHPGHRFTVFNYENLFHLVR